MPTPLEVLRQNVTGKIETGEAVAIVQADEDYARARYNEAATAYHDAKRTAWLAQEKMGYWGKVLDVVQGELLRRK